MMLEQKRLAKREALWVSYACCLLCALSSRCQPSVIRMDLPLGCGADGNAFALQIFAKTAVELCQAAKLEVGHGLAGSAEL